MSRSAAITFAVRIAMQRPQAPLAWSDRELRIGCGTVGGTPKALR